MQHKALQDKPWYRFWPEGVPQQLDYPEIPLFWFLSQAAEKWPDSIAFCCQGQRLSYGELDDLTSRLATGLHNLGIGTGDKITLFLANGLEFVMGYYGILKAGGTITLANPLYRQAELKHQLNDTMATAIITNSDLYPLVKEVQAETKLKAIILTDAEIGNGTIPLREILEGCSATPPRFTVKPKEEVAVS